MTGISPQPITSLYFDWGARPPLNATVYISNSSYVDGGLYGTEEILAVMDVTPSLPYDAAAEGNSTQQVQPVVGNRTAIAVEGGAWSGNYARLVITGCWEPDGEGATVGEFVLGGVVE